MPTAIVTGATGKNLPLHHHGGSQDAGMTGHAIVEALQKNDKYKKIFTMSRSQQREDSPKTQHATLDLQADAKDMAKQLESLPEIDHIFFCAYLAKDQEDEADKVNTAMLSNFIDALEITGHCKTLTRFILTCGLKQYGVHLGKPKNPMYESDDPEAHLTGDVHPPNFYYSQQRILSSAASKQGWSWVCTYPQDVIGYARGNFMNLSTSLGLYAAVSAAMPNNQLVFPGNKINYLAFNCWTSARLHAEFCLWAAEAEGAANQGFNVVNGDTQSWQDIWPRIAKCFGAKLPEHMFPGNAEIAYPGWESTEMDLLSRPPIAEFENGMGLKGEFKQSRVHCQIDLIKWAKKEEVVKAWQKVRDEYGLEQDAWDKATWGFLTFLVGRQYDCVVSMSKARKLGWTGYRDTWDEFAHAFDVLAQEKILPPKKA